MNGIGTGVVLERLGKLAIEECDKWRMRNEARNNLRSFMKTYRIKTGEFFEKDRAEVEDVCVFESLQQLARQTQLNLIKARGKTRRLAMKLRDDAAEINASEENARLREAIRQLMAVNEMLAKEIIDVRYPNKPTHP